MEVTLSVIRGKVNRGEIAFHPPAVLGRSREADLTIAHPMISRQHCELFEVDGLLMVRDLESLNGTVVLNRRILESPLRPDDSFSVGPLMFRVRYQYDGDLTAVPPPKLAEPDGGESLQVAPPLGGQEAAETPVFSEIGEPSVGEPGRQESPWAEALPADEEGESDEAGSDEQPAAPLPGIGTISETLPSRDAVEPTIDLSAGQSGGEDDADEADAEVQPEGSLDTRTGAVERPDAAASEPGKKKRSWSLWPFGGKKRSKAKGKDAVPAAEEPAEPAAEAEPADEIDEAEVPFQTSGAQDTRQDEAVAEFLADEEPEDSGPPDEEPEPDEEPKPGNEPQPEEESESDAEDDAFQDFLKGIQ